MIGLAAFGSLLGVVFEAKVFGTHKFKAFNKTSIWKSALRLAVMIGGQQAFIWLGTALSGYAFKAFGLHPDVSFVLKKAIPAFCGNFYVFGLSRWISMKLRLINTDTTVQDEAVS